MSNFSSNASEGELQITESPLQPFQVLYTDHFGPLKETSDGFKHILLLIDTFTRFIWFFAVKTTVSREVIKHFSLLFRIFGNPRVIVSDRNTAFTSQEFVEFLRNKSIKHCLIAVVAPWANGLAEKANRFLKSFLKKIVDKRLERLLRHNTHLA